MEHFFLLMCMFLIAFLKTVAGRGNYDEITLLPKINMAIDIAKKTTNKTLAISMAEPAIPPNPNTAATIAITKNVAAQFNIEASFLLSYKITD